MTSVENLNIAFLVINVIILVAFMGVFHAYDTYPSEQLKTSKTVLAIILQIVFMIFLWLYIGSIIHNLSNSYFSIITLLLSVGYILAYYINPDKPVVAQQSLQRSFQQTQRSLQQPQQPINHLQLEEKALTLPMTENVLTSSPTIYDKVYSEFIRVKDKYL